MPPLRLVNFEFSRLMKGWLPWVFVRQRIILRDQVWTRKSVPKRRYTKRLTGEYIKTELCPECKPFMMMDRNCKYFFFHSQRIVVHTWGRRAWTITLCSHVVSNFPREVEVVKIWTETLAHKMRLAFLFNWRTRRRIVRLCDMIPFP